jgi:hypothetical protein
MSWQRLLKATPQFAAFRDQAESARTDKRVRFIRRKEKDPFTENASSLHFAGETARLSVKGASNFGSYRK